MKVAVVTCYRDTNYVRAKTLRAAAERLENTELFLLQNRHRGLFRYPEILLKVLRCRIIDNPDVYILTFRAYEILPAIVLLIGKKKLIYDEFINPLEWLNEDRSEWWARFVPKKLLQIVYRLLLKRCDIILHDTAVHADYSAKIMNMPRELYADLPVGADESTFFPANVSKTEQFSVLYYGSMLPLHGIDIVIQIAIKLKDQPLTFIIVGQGKNIAEQIKDAENRGANIRYYNWIDYKQLPTVIQQAHLVLGGPFGNTTQANMVTTGKTFQALACGSAVLVGQTKANTKFVDTVNCLKVPLGDSVSLADKISWAANHPWELEKISLEGHELFKRTYSYEQLAARLAAIMKRIA